MSSAPPTFIPCKPTLRRLWIPYQHLTTAELIILTSELPLLTCLAFTADVDDDSPNRFAVFIDRLKKLAPILQELWISSLWSDYNFYTEGTAAVDPSILDDHWYFFDTIILTVPFPKLHTLTLSVSRWTEASLNSLMKLPSLNYLSISAPIFDKNVRSIKLRNVITACTPLTSNIKKVTFLASSGDWFDIEKEFYLFFAHTHIKCNWIGYVTTFY